MRQVVLDTETTGLEPSQGHRIIEIGCVETIGRRLTERRYRQYLNPERQIDDGAFEVHGITAAFLADKPCFAQIAQEFIDFVKGAELIIHNAPFDVAFINYELRLLGPEWGQIEDYCTVLDTLALARELHPGQKNSLDALCKRYRVDNSQREQHGALLDAEILTDVYLAMTGGQAKLLLDGTKDGVARQRESLRSFDATRPRLRLTAPTASELAAHQRRLAAIEEVSGRKCLWIAQDGAKGGTDSIQEPHDPLG
ncbi:MAG: DNA polymerase III subunit epsilon [Gammaproteobacteria bacterium]|nr:DNA polymerase III subunit epsilon [Gammaproteobacteria bacterium]MCI0591391.1 DNA polymerase III subunit epsilon [Gammaproteobacteria bacterium]